MYIDVSRLPKNIQHAMLLLQPNAMFWCSPDVQEEAVTQNPLCYFQFENPTLIAGLIAVGNDPDIFQKFLDDFPDCDEDIQVKAVEARPWNIEHINKPCQKALYRFFEIMGNETFSDDLANEYKVLMQAIEMDTEVIRFIEKPTREMMLAAINENPESIRWLTDPDEEMQLAATVSPDAVCWMTNNKNINFTPKVKRLARKTLLLNISHISPNERENGYRRALFSISTDAELLDMLRNPLFALQPETLDFESQPSDEILKLLMLRQGIKTYFSQAQPGWIYSEELQAWMAQQRWGSEFGYDYIPDPCRRAKFAYVGAVAEIKLSGSTPPTEKACLKAIDRCRLGYIHKVFECIPKPGKNVKIRYIERVAGTKCGNGSNPSYKIIERAIKRCEAASHASRIAAAAASLDHQFSKAWEICSLFYSGDDIYVTYDRINLFLKEIRSIEEGKSGAAFVDALDLPTISPEDIYDDF